MKLFIIPNRNCFEIAFAFDKKIIDIIKKVDKCKFNSEFKKWYCDKDSIQLLIRTAKVNNLEVIHAIDSSLTANDYHGINDSIAGDDEKIVLNNMQDGSLSIDLPLSKNVYFKLKTFDSIVWSNNKWTILDKDKNRFYDLCTKNNIKIITE